MSDQFTPFGPVQGAGSVVAPTIFSSGGRDLGPGQLGVDNEMLYESYAGTDITAIILLPDEPAPMALGELQTLSYSIHRENVPVRLLGHTNVRGFVKGPRTIAGSMVFYQFNQYAWYRLKTMQQMVSKRLFSLADMLPPFDIVLSFMNEYGSFSKMRIYGVSIIDEGTTMSIDDFVTEQTYSYMARGIEPLTSYVPQGFEKLPTYGATAAHVRPSITYR